MNQDKRALTLAEIDRALWDMQAALGEAIREGDDDLYISVARRIERLWERRDALTPPQVGPFRQHGLISGKGHGRWTGDSWKYCGTRRSGTCSGR